MHIDTSQPAAGYPAKRFLDVSLSLLTLSLLWPFMLVAAILIRLFMGGPIIFHQIRPGLGERLFAISKFRTMSNATDSKGELLSDVARLTWLGRLLRRTSIDELPQLINVLRGEMSLVGPRPLLTQYLPYYRPEERIRFSVRPGITGLAQIRGRNDLSWDDRMAADREYAANCSLRLDLTIILDTVAKILTAKSVQEDGASAMLLFDEERRGTPAC
jgi:lipopolysaccharide/colanic/teichoic acid biosynthesis glycosyltransferase